MGAYAPNELGSVSDPCFVGNKVKINILQLVQRTDSPHALRSNA